jgi:hypothetical protein
MPMVQLATLVLHCTGWRSTAAPSSPAAASALRMLHCTSSSRLAAVLLPILMSAAAGLPKNMLRPRLATAAPRDAYLAGNHLAAA